MWSDLSCPSVIAHRGDKTHAPENTLAAFKLAAEKGADAIELDVKLTADGEVIVLHDQTVDRTTNGNGKVTQLQFKTVRGLDAGIKFSEMFRGEHIPLLGEVFETVGKRLHINIELANYATPGDPLVSKVVDLVKKHGLQNRMLFSSFFAGNLRKARLLLPEVPRGLLCIPGFVGSWGRTFTWRGDYFALHPNRIDITQGMVDRVHAAGKRVNVWTVNAEEDLKKMIGFGVDGIFTDDPELALRLLGRGK
jgi:glycerophosphoryl diester phosphodiesterase